MATHRLPPFAALRAFDALAETLSFTQAAKRLGVTQAAVSRQVRLLERELGARLVERRAGYNELTVAGATLHEALREGLDRIAAAVRAVSTAPGRSILVVSVAPFFSAVWLTPRIMRFLAAHPDIDLRLHHAYLPPDYRRDQIDMGLNWGEGRWPGVVAEKVFDGALAPVCSPAFLAAHGPIDRPQDLARAPLFCEFAAADWNAWFAAAGVACDVAGAVTRIDDSSALRRIALDGHGVALFFDALAQDDFALGTLVRPFQVSVDTGCHYFLTHPADREPTAAAKAFRRWLRAELAVDAAIA